MEHIWGLAGPFLISAGSIASAIMLEIGAARFFLHGSSRSSPVLSSTAGTLVVTRVTGEPLVINGAGDDDPVGRDRSSATGVEAWVESFIETTLASGVAPPLDEWLQRAPSRCRPELRSRLAAFLRLEEALGGDPAVNTADDTLTGSQFGDFRIDRLLAVGGMSAVYLAEQLSLGRIVALKILPAALGPRGSAGERFRREAKVIAKLRHPNIVGIHAYGEEQGTSYLALDYVEGRTCAELIEDQRVRGTGRGPGTEWARTVVELACSVSDALGYAHAHGIVHRDIKPSNIIVDAAGAPHVVDFGLAKDALSVSLSDSGDFLGTPQYMAPEQFDGEYGEIDARTDVYGLGATLYECLALVPPHDGSTLDRLVQQVTRVEPTSLGRLRVGVSRDLVVIVHTCLEKDPDRRYQSAFELSADLRRYLGGKPILARPTSVWRRVARYSARRPAVVSILVLVLALIVALGAVGVMRDRLADERTRADLEQRGRDGMRLLGEVPAVIDRDPGLALRLAGEGADRAPGLVANNALYAAWRAVAEAGPAPRVIDAHRGHVHRVVHDDGGTLIASGSADGTAAVWHASDGTLVARFRGHRGAVLNVDWAPDSRRLITASLDGTARLWDLASPSEPVCVFPNAAPSHCARFVDGGRSIIVASLDGTLSSYSTESPFALRWRNRSLPTVSVGRYVDIWSEVEAAIAVSEDRRWIAAGTLDDRVVLWDASTGQSCWASEPLEDRVCAVQFARDGSRLVAYCFASSFAVVHAVSDGRLIARLGNSDLGELRGVAISDDGETVVTSDAHGCDVWGVMSCARVAERRRPNLIAPRQHFAAFRPGRSEFASTFIGGSSLIGEGGEARIALRSEEVWTSWLDFHPGGERVVTGSSSGRIRSWDLRASDHRASLETGIPRVRSIQYDAAARRVLVSGEVTLGAEELDLEAGTRIWAVGAVEVGGSRTALDHSAPAETVTFATYRPSANAVTVVSTRHLFERSTPDSGLKPQSTDALVGPDLTLRRISFDSTGNTFILCVRRNVDGKVLVGARDSGPLIELTGHPRAPRTAEFDPGGDRIVTSCLDGRCRIYHLPRTSPVITFDGHEGDVRFARFSPDGSQVVSCSWDQTARVWEPSTGRELLVLSGHRQSVETADFSPDGRVIVTGSLDGTARLWDANDGTLLAVVSFPGAVYSVVFRSDGREFAAAGDARVVQFWPYPPTDVERRPLSLDERIRYSLEPTSPTPATPPPDRTRSFRNEVAYALFRSLLDQGVAGVDAERRTEWKRELNRLEGERDYGGPLAALVHLQCGEFQLALDESRRFNARSIERVNREDLIAVCVEAAAQHGLGDLKSAEFALERASGLASAPPWNWPRDPDPISYFEIVRARVRSDRP